MMDADAIDLSKENIQPLKHGRKARLLGLALQAQTDCDVHQKLLKDRDEFEMLIRLYDGPDPLKPRYDYVLWLEQSYPKHGRESNLLPLLEDTITVFKDNELYRQDSRFVELIIKFIETQVNSLELYQVVYNLGIGTMCSLFYKSWAEELDGCNDIKRADNIYKLGIANHAEPLESLKQEHKQFQLSICRRMISGDELLTSKEEATEKPRQVLGKLRSKVGSSRPTYGKAGVVPLCLSNRNVPINSNTLISIYSDSALNDERVNSVDDYQVQHLPKSDLAKKENSLKPAPWTKAYKPPKVHHVYTPSTPSFKVHEDVEPSTPMTPMASCPSALKTRKGDFHCPIAIFEPPDPSIKPMYCKSKIYVGGREFQFEEIQAALYFKKLRKQIEKDELEKLGVKMTGLSCLTTPQAVRKASTEDETEPSTPLCKELKTPLVYEDKLEPVTPATRREDKAVYSLSHSVTKHDFKTPLCKPTFQPVTPFDLPSHELNEILMEGAETSVKLPQRSFPTKPPEEKVTENKLNKPGETTSNVKKFLNFAVYCDDD